MANRHSLCRSVFVPRDRVAFVTAARALTAVHRLHLAEVRASYRYCRYTGKQETSIIRSVSTLTISGITLDRPSHSYLP